MALNGIFLPPRLRLRQLKPCAVSDPVSFYDLYRGIDPSDLPLLRRLTSLEQTQGLVSDPTPPNPELYYQVNAVSVGGRSRRSDILRVGLFDLPPPLTITQANGTNALAWTWPRNLSAHQCLGVYVQRSITSMSAPNGTTYYYSNNGSQLPPTGNGWSTIHSWSGSAPLSDYATSFTDTPPAGYILAYRVIAILNANEFKVLTTHVAVAAPTPELSMAGEIDGDELVLSWSLPLNPAGDLAPSDLLLFSGLESLGADGVSLVTWLAPTITEYRLPAPSGDEQRFEIQGLFGV